MSKPKDDSMRNNLQFVRLFADREAVAVIDRICRSERRSKQRQIGIFLEVIAQLYRDRPETLRELGFISRLPAIATI